MKFHIKVTRKDGVKNSYSVSGFFLLADNLNLFPLKNKTRNQIVIEASTIAKIEIKPL